MNFAAFYQQSIDDPASFWANEARRIDWHSPFSQALDHSRAPFTRWFLDGQTNLCHNAVDRHLAQRADQPALIAVSTETQRETTYSFAELHREVNAMAALMLELGVGRGDRVLIYMPMIAEAVFAMLACARIGAVHSVVFGGFAAHELATRIDDSQPKAILAASCGIEPGRVVLYKPLLDRAIEEAAQNLGANSWVTFWRITLPSIRPGIVAGALFGFVTSFGNLEMSLFLVGAGRTTLPIVILQYLEWKIDPTIAAVSVVQIVLIAGAMLVTDRYVKLARVV